MPRTISSEDDSASSRATEPVDNSTSSSDADSLSSSRAREKERGIMNGYRFLDSWLDFPAIRYWVETWLQDTTPYVEQELTKGSESEWERTVTAKTLELAIEFWKTSGSHTSAHSKIKCTYREAMRARLESVCGDRLNAMTTELRRAREECSQHLLQKCAVQKPDLEEILSKLFTIYSPLGTSPSRKNLSNLPDSERYDDDGHAILDLCMRRLTLVSLVDKRAMVNGSGPAGSMSAAILLAHPDMWSAKDMGILETATRCQVGILEDWCRTKPYAFTRNHCPRSSNINSRLRSGKRYVSPKDFIPPLRDFADRLDRMRSSLAQASSCGNNPLSISQIDKGSPTTGRLNHAD